MNKGRAGNPRATGEITPGQAKAWVRFGVAGGRAFVQASYNVASVTRTSQGVFGIRFLRPFSTALWVGMGGGTDGTHASAGFVTTVDAGMAVFQTTLPTAFDPTEAHVVFFGPQ